MRIPWRSAGRTNGYEWISEIKTNGVAIYKGMKRRLNELADRLRSEGMFHDAFIDGEIYQSCRVDVFMKRLGAVSIIIDVKVDTKDIHFPCTDTRGGTMEEMICHALERHKIEDFHKGAKYLGLREYRFRESEAALIHAHLVCLTYTLLDVLRRKLLRYGVTKGLISLEGTVEWVRKKAMHLFIHGIAKSRLCIRSLLSLIGTD